MADFRLFSTLRYDARLRAVPHEGPSHAGWNHSTSSAIYMLDLHRDRLLRAASHWGWEPAVRVLEGPEGLASLAQRFDEFVGPDQTTPLRLKVLVDHEGQLAFEKADTPELPLEQLFPSKLPAPGHEAGPHEAPRTSCFKLVLDSKGTPRSAHTHYKTTHRPVYDAARQRANVTLSTPTKEVLVVGDDGSVMEASITTPYFWRGGRWVTPPVSRNGYSDIEGSGGQEGTSRRWALER